MTTATRPIVFEMSFTAAWEALNGVKVRGHSLDETIARAKLWNLPELDGLRKAREANREAEQVLRSVLDIAAAVPTEWGGIEQYQSEDR